MRAARGAMRDRIVTPFPAEAEGIDPDTVIGHRLEAIPPSAERAVARLVGAD